MAERQEETKRVPLSVNEIMELLRIVDNERQRTRKLVERYSNSKDNKKREKYIESLDGLTNSLRASIG
jgi:hypothetical protein